ncbi:glycosyltransferase family 4 protein [Desulfococcaceae bacterium HSG8]|nr:glycosyltransferase family 4 protein [Desulfococcaceae bacterium HSG8]
MRILLIADNCSIKMGGEAILAYHYFRLLKKNNRDVKLLVHGRNKAELKELFLKYTEDIFYVEDTKLQAWLWKTGSNLPQRVSDVTFYFLISLLTNIRMKMKAKELVEKHNIDIIHQPIPVSPKAPSFIYNLGSPVIIGPMNGGMEFPEAFKGMVKFAEKISYRIAKALANIMNLLIPGKRKSDLLLCANERTKDALPKAINRNQVKILVENGVDLSLWEKNKSDNHSNSLEFTFIGRLVDWKGVDYLLKAFKIVAEKTSIKLNIIGDGREKNSLENKAVNYKIRDKVRFWGFVDQKKIPEILKKSRALILPSLYECGGAVILEAMALELPVIATKWGGPVDYLDEECGILVEPDSKEGFINGLAEAMRKLANDEALAKKMGKSGRKKIEEYYDWNKKIEFIINYYRDVFKKHL